MTSNSSSAISLRDIVYNEAGKNYSVPPHIHQHYQWYCVLHGGVDTLIENKTFSLNPDESVLIPPGVLRSPRSRDKAPRYLHAVFENHRLNLDNLPGKVLLLSPDLRPDLTALVKELIHPGTNTNELVEVLLIRLLIGLERSQQNNDKVNHISTIELAKSFHCKNIRIFGGGDSQCFSRSELINIGLDCFENIVALDGANDLNWFLETHNQWTKTSDCQKFIKNIHHTSFGILWDIGHTTRVNQEKPARSLKRLGDNFKYIHIKDAIYNPNHPLAMDDGWYYVLPGDGQLPISSALKLLNEIDYAGWIVFEHEKRWHPELAEPDEALLAFINWLKSHGFFEQ